MRSPLPRPPHQLRKNTFLVVSVMALIIGCIILAGSRSFVEHVLTKKGAKVGLMAKIETYRRLEKMVDSRAQSSAAEIRLDVVNRYKEDSLILVLMVNARTTEDAINEVNRLTQELRSELEQQHLEPPSIVMATMPVPIVTDSVRLLWNEGRIAGVSLLGLSLVTVILHFAKKRRETPPPLPGQEGRGDDTVTYDY